ATLEWDFGKGYLWKIQVRGAGLLTFDLSVPNKKNFSKDLKLISAQIFAAPPSETPPDREMSTESEKFLRSESAAHRGREEAKALRLLKNIQNDVLSAKTWVDTYARLCTELESRPWL